MSCFLPTITHIAPHLSLSYIFLVVILMFLPFSCLHLERKMHICLKQSYLTDYDHYTQFYSESQIITELRKGSGM